MVGLGHVLEGVGLGEGGWLSAWRCEQQSGEGEIAGRWVVGVVG